MFRKKRSSQTSIVGLELDAGHLAAAEVSVDGSITLTRGAVAELRPGVMRDGEVADPDRPRRGASRRSSPRTTFPSACGSGIAHQRIVVRTLDLPVVVDDPKALAAAVRAAAPDHIPMPMDEAVLDFQPLGVVNTPIGPALARRRRRRPQGDGRARRRRRRGRRPGDRGHRPLGLRHGPRARLRARGRRPLHQRRRPRQRRRRQRRAAACSRARPRAAIEAIATRPRRAPRAHARARARSG